MSLAITRRDLSAEALRGHARRCQDVQQACRLLALALVLDGASRTEAARAGGMDRQTLRDWVIRYNEAGVEGLLDLPRSGRPPRLNAVHLAELARLVEEGPDIAVHGVVRWRCVDLQAQIKAQGVLSPRSSQYLWIAGILAVCFRMGSGRVTGSEMSISFPIGTRLDGGLARAGRAHGENRASDAFASLVVVG